MRAAFAALLTSLAGPALASDFSLSLPVDCTLGETCHIQQFMDRDPGPDAQDFTCGPLSYDGHKGTDFALSTFAEMNAGVDVLAAAPGVVTGVRDGMADLLYTPERSAEIDGRDCGNGLVIDHGEGWVTQYCHLKKGTVAVARGARVEKGDRLGEIGLSGRTQFPHLHLSVRKDGREIDPFGTRDTNTCSLPLAGETALWTTPIPYTPGAIMTLGFSEMIPDYEAVQAGTASSAITPESPAFVLYAFAFGSRSGDRLVLSVDGPQGTLFSQDITLERTQARFFRATGKRRSAPWPRGIYEGSALLIRDDRVIDSADIKISVD